MVNTAICAAELGPEKAPKENETLLDYLKRTKVLAEEIQPLWSKASVMRAFKENRSIKDRSNLLKQVREKTRIFIDTNLIRDHYGDEVAIY